MSDGHVQRVACLVVAGLLLAAPGVAAADPVYVGASLWSAKHTAGVDATWYSNRDLWEAKATGGGVRVGIVSTGVDASHPDLDDRVVAFKDLVDARPDAYDDHGFGTFLAGVVAGTGHFQWSPLQPYWLTGARGVAPDATLLVAKAVDAHGSASDVDVARAVRWMLDPDGDGRSDDRAHVILLPTEVESPKLPPSQSTHLELGERTKDAVQDAIERGVIVVVSAGDTNARLATPADLPLALVVGAVDRQGTPAAFNAHGPGLDVLAPGALVGPWPEGLDVSDYAADGYASVVGTGVAAAFAAGVVALMVGADPALAAPTDAVAEGVRRANTVQNALKENAVALGGTPENEGSGMISVSPALAAVDKGADGFDWRFVALALLALAGLGYATWRKVDAAATATAKRKAEDAED